jgi:N-acetylglucosaminylphosphatidylinositol deacetylase
MWLIGIFVFVVCVAVSLRWTQGVSEGLKKSLYATSAALIVFAHPDDEIMFFLPTILLLQKLGISIHFLCLSTGNYDGLGQTRRKEFELVSCKLGIVDSEIIDIQSMQDGPNYWPAESVSKVVSSYMKKHVGISAVFTFDARGVSDHPNHISVHKGLVHLYNKERPNWNLFCLTSVGIFRKYCPLIDWCLLPFSRSLWTLEPTLQSLALMRHYESQNVWFRKLFSIFSRYSYLNDYTAIVNNN